MPDRVRLYDEDDGLRRCYVYVWFYADGRPLYVGKGTYRSYDRRQRWGDHLKSSSNKALAGVFRKASAELPIVIIAENLSNREAFSLEVSLIKAIGRADLGTGPLVNHTDGGEGPANLSAKAIAAISAAAKLPKSEDHKRKIGASQPKIKPRIAKTPPMTVENRQRVRDWHARMTPEQKAARALKISIATKEAMVRSGASEKISRALTGRVFTEAEKEANRQGVLRALERDPSIRVRISLGVAASGTTRFSGHHHTEATRKKMSESQKRVAAERRELVDA